MSKVSTGQQSGHVRARREYVQRIVINREGLAQGKHIDTKIAEVTGLLVVLLQNSTPELGDTNSDARLLLAIGMTLEP